MRLDGRIALVTGGGRGIGAAAARALAGAGATTVVVARSRDQIDAVRDALEADGHRAHAFAADVTDPDAVQELARAVTAACGAVDILVNNAGAASSAPFLRQTLEEWNRLFAVNATSAFLCMQAFLPEMLRRDWGRIVNIASVAALAGARYIAAYTASKHALLGLTRAAAAEYDGTGVTVNAICPGYVDTPMTDATLSRIAEKTGRGRDEALRAVLAEASQARLIQPGEVAEQVLRICAAGDLNGEAIVIDGGMDRS